jgi:dihydrofolate reductase
MRKLIVAEFISLDGVVEAPEQWHFPYVDEALQAGMWAVNAEIDTFLLGRVTYDTFAAAFATAPADDPVAAELNKPAKVVVSSSLRDPVWAKTTVIDGDSLEEGVRELKEQSGSGILVNGSITLVRSLLRAGLVDELHLLVHPILVGKGERLFPAEGDRVPLELVKHEVLDTGVTICRYRVAH